MKFSVVTPLWQDRAPGENLAIAQLADRQGFEELWIGEMATYDAFAFATAVTLKTQDIQLTVGPLAVAARTPMTIAMGVASVADLGDRQTNVALGASSLVVVEQWHGREHAHSATRLDETAQILRTLLDGEKAFFSGKQASCRGYRLRLAAPQSSITIAAFAPGAVRAAARRADRMLLNMVTPSSLERLRRQLTGEARQCQRNMPRVAVWLPCALDPAPETVDQLKRAVVGYLAAPGYGEMMMEAGFADLVSYARSRPHPRDLLAAMPDELIAAIGLVGDRAHIRDRIAEYKAAGADEICLVPATAGDPLGECSLNCIPGLN